MKQKIEEFLKNNDLLPIINWHSFEVVHKDTSPESSKDLDEIKDIISGKNGLYIYEKDGVIIYVGKGKPIFSRIRNHYISSYQKVSGDTKDDRWHRFFSSHRGNLKIYWKTVEGEEMRHIYEMMLHHVLNPKFNSFK